jgi:hypothetical protein
MDISQMQSIFQEGTEQSQFTKQVQEQKSALQEGKIPSPSEDVNPNVLSSGQRDINEALLPGDGQEQNYFADETAEGHDPICDIPDERPMGQAEHPETGEPLEIDGEPIGEDGLTDSQRDEIEDMRNHGDHEGAAETAQFYRGANQSAWEIQHNEDWPEEYRWPIGSGEY